MRSGLIVGAVLLVIVGVWWAAVGSTETVEPDRSSEPQAALPRSTPHAGTRSAPRVIAPTSAKPEPVPAEAEEDPAAEKAAAAAVVPGRGREFRPTPPPAKLGPVDALQQVFETEPRDSAASDVESRIRAVFSAENIPPTLLADVLCRQTVCRIDIRWRGDHNGAYMIGLSRAVEVLGKEVAINPTAPADESGVMPIEVYWRRKADPTP